MYLRENIMYNGLLNFQSHALLCNLKYMLLCLVLFQLCFRAASKVFFLENQIECVNAEYTEHLKRNCYYNILLKRSFNMGITIFRVLQLLMEFKLISVTGDIKRDNIVIDEFRRGKLS